MFEMPAIRPSNWLKAACYTSVLLLLYNSTLKELIFQWSGEDYSYCWLVPFIVLYLIWEKRDTLARLSSTPSWRGLAPLFAGIVLFWLGTLGGEYTTLYLSLWFVIIGLVLLHSGRQKVRSLAFPFLLMLASIPMPNYINTRLTAYAKMISSQLGAGMLYTLGIPAFREGNVIDLGFAKLQVVDACSGLRYTLPLMLLGLLLAYWYRAHIWKRTALFFSSIPVSILMNSFRIALTGILYGAIGPAAAEGFFHGFSGWLIFMAALLVFAVEMWLLKKMPPKDPVKRRPRLSSGTEAAVNTADGGKSNKEVSAAKSFRQPQFAVAIAMLLLTFGLSHSIEFHQKVPIRKPFSQFPAQVGQWKGTREVMDEQFRSTLNFSDYVLEDFTGPHGKTVNLYVAYYQDQSKGESIHSPETCYPANGWTFKRSDVASVSLAGGKTMAVSRAFMEKAGVRELSYYWFPQRGRILTRLYQLKLFTFWDALTRRRTDGAVVLLVTPVYSSEKLQDSENRLKAFTRRIVPVLDEYIPGKSINNP
ncbi:MAG: VPLPA-CTERM-specific exosortase XrtD [Nitrospiraceae bacterium]|nr:VPLPA-CTERM-specific exosortase XrtD [Nitrospiraceae bacterium]